MKNKVFFIPIKESYDENLLKSRLSTLLDQSKILDSISKTDSAMIKIHFGEEGNTGHVKPLHLKSINEHILRKGVKTVISDTNTLYKGRRTNSKDHLLLANEHGFTEKYLGSLLNIPDDTKPENVSEIKINGKYVKTAKVAKLFSDCDVIVGIAHFKGHIMCGFGGAIKNIGMGCASRKGKMEQHSDLSPIILVEACVGCGACRDVCPANAITLKDNKALLDRNKCIGCASCLSSCEYHAIEIDWLSGAETIQQKMVEYAKAVIMHKPKKMIFINFVTKITKECDCLAKDDPRIAPDIGILASTDPVSIDKASLDLILKSTDGKDVFREAHPYIDGNSQLNYAQESGLGSLDYELIEVE